MSWQYDYMEIAKIISKRSTCNRGAVGAVLTRGRRIISTGYNGAPSGMPHCQHDDHDDIPCFNAVHAEANVVAFAAKYGVSTDDTALFVTKAPCVFCAQLLVNAGVREVYFRDEYRSERGVEVLYGAGVRLFRVARPEVSAMSSIQDYQPSLYCGERSDFEPTTEYEAMHSGGGPGSQGRTNQPTVQRDGGSTPVGGTVSLRPQQGTLFSDQRRQV